MKQNKKDGHVWNAARHMAPTQWEMQSNMPDTTSSPETLRRERNNGVNGQKRKIYATADYEHSKT